MDDIGELLVIGGLLWFVCAYGDDWFWAFSLGMIVIGATLYFIDRAISRPRR